jgi:hypothetical protein
LLAVLVASTVGGELSADTRSILRVHHNVQTACVKREESKPHSIKPNISYSFPLGKFASVFHTEIYAILLCVYENIRRAYKNKWILIFSDSQAALKALSGPKVTSRLVEEYLDALSVLASLNEVTLVWVPRHHGILGNEKADKFGRHASAMPLLSPEPALGILKCLAREAIKNWAEYQHLSTWKDMPGCRHGKLFIGRPCKKELMTCLN